MTAPHACPSYVTEGAAGDSNRSADWRVSKVNRSRMQCNPSWKTQRKRFGQENITSLTMRDKKEAWDALTADVNAVSSSRRKPDELKKKWQKLASDARSDLAKRKHPGTGGGPKPRESPYTDLIRWNVGMGW